VTETAQTAWLTDESLDLVVSDAFDVAPFVDRLADLVEAGDPPFTVSLSGSWGLGKSTVAEGLMTRVKSRGIPGVLIDAWTEDVEHLRRTLAIAVGAELRGGPEYREVVADEIDAAIHLSRTETLPPKPELRVMESLRDIRRRPEVFVWLVAFDLLFLFLTLASAVWLPATTGAFSTVLGASLVFTALQTGLFFRIETASQSRAPAHESVETAKRFRALVTNGGDEAPEKVLVVVDNLDRLQGSDALRALAEIRALVEIKGSRAIFLIPIDRAALARHIEPRLGPNGAGTARSRADPAQADGLAAKDYLEKFFNLDLLLARPEVLDLRQWALGEARKVLPASDETDLVTAVQVVASAANGSPRSVKRIINGVSSRNRLIDPKFVPVPSLTQLAFVEGLLTQYPEVISWLGSDPREFIAYRTGVADEAATPDPSPPLTPDREQQLRSYLLANSEIVLTATMIRTVMSLRQDRVWQGVSDPGPIQDALDAGQAEAIRSAINAIDPDERSLAVLRSVSYIERSVSGFPRDAVTNLVALGGIISDYPDAAKVMHPMAVRAFRAADDTNRRRISRPLARFLLGAGYVHPKLADLATKFVTTLAGANPQTEVTEGLVWAIREAGSHLTGDQIAVAREALKGIDDDLLAPLFEAPVDHQLIEGPVAALYLDRLTAWDATADQAPIQIATERLQALVDDGWRDLDSMRQIAARVTTQIPSFPDDAERQHSLGGMVALVRSAPAGDEVDQLATSLVGAPGTVDPPARIASLLYLPVRSPAKPTIEIGITTWLRSVRPDFAERLVIGHRAALIGFGYDATPVLTSRWIGGEGRQWAELAAELNAGTDPELLTTPLAGTADTSYAGFVAEVAGIAEARKDLSAAEALSAEIAVRCRELPAASLENLGDTLTSLRRTGAGLSSIIAALETRIGTDPAVGPLAHSVRGLHEHGVKEMRALAKPLAARGSAAGGVELTDTEWLVRSSGGTTEARHVLIRAIESGPITQVCPVVDTVADPLHKHADVRLALTRRASSGVSEEEATMLLNSALAWKMPGGSDLLDYRHALTEVAKQWPSATGLVNRLQ
jgi:hypothetical protein